MKHAFLGIFFCFYLNISLGQSVDSMLAKYMSSVKNIDVVSYELQRIDTFTNGAVWNNSGKCVLKRLDQDSVIGFAFRAIRSDVKKVYLFDGGSFFEIDEDKKTYRVTNMPTKGILGSPGGQMAVEELAAIDKRYSKASYIETDSAYILRLDYPDNLTYSQTNHYKRIFLDKTRFLPFRIESSIHALGKVQTNILILSNLNVNNYALANQISDKDFLIHYNQDIPAEAQDDLNQLIGQQAYSFQLKGIDEKLFQLKQQLGKVVLLDFWDVWCAPCIGSMPKIQSLHEKYEKKGLVVIGVLLNDQSLTEAKLLVHNKKLTFINLVGNKKVIDEYKVNGIPQYVIIDEDGRIILASAGYDDKIEQMLMKKFQPQQLKIE